VRSEIAASSEAIRLDRQVSYGEAFALEFLAAFEYAFVLRLQGYDVVAKLPALGVGTREMRSALDREVVRFGGARGEDELARIGIDQRSDLAARPLDSLGGDAAIGVARTVRIAEILGEIRQHRLEHARVDPGR
jgi:hypothetical protein